jgi:hypothetical protein
MQYRVIVPVAPTQLGAILQACRSADPAALVDIDGVADELRVSTSMTAGELVQALGTAGLAVPDSSVRLRPSECCGGCSG